MWQTFLIDVIKKVAVGESSDSANLVTNASETKVFLKATQGEVGTQFRAILLDNGEPYHVSAGAEFSIWYEGASGKGNYTQIGGRSPVTISGNVLQVELIPQMTSVAGGGVLAVMLHGSDGSIRKLFHLTYIVDEFPGYGSEEAKAYFTAFSEAVADVKDSAAKVAEAVAAFETDKNLSVAGKAADAAATGEALAGKAPLALGAPHNYLDNSDFRNPVNQRGNSNYVGGGGYSLDRWILQLSTNLAVNDGYITLSGLYDIKQKNGFTVKAGQAYTLAVRLRGTSAPQNVQLSCFEGTHAITLNNTDWQTVAVSRVLTNDYDIGAATAAFIGLAASGGSIQLEWASLYKGVYTVETLPDYKPKGYGVELAECMRYFERIGYSPNGVHASMFICISSDGGMRSLFNYTVPKRVVPTVLLNGSLPGETVSLRNSLNNDYCTGEFRTWNEKKERINSITIAGGTSTVGAPYEGYLDVCADL